jgi:hypothetical protein
MKKTEEVIASMCTKKAERLVLIFDKASEIFLLLQIFIKAV